jgi:hypothetical protein
MHGATMAANVDEFRDCVLECYMNVSLGVPLDSTLAYYTHFEEPDWCMMTAALLAWHNNASDAAVRWMTDGLSEKCSVLDALPSAREIEDAFDNIMDQHTILRSWQHEYTSLFRTYGVFIIPDNVPLSAMVELNKITDRTCNNRSIDQIDAWIFGQIGRLQANRTYGSSVPRDTYLQCALEEVPACNDRVVRFRSEELSVCN